MLNCIAKRTLAFIIVFILTLNIVQQFISKINERDNYVPTVVMAVAPTPNEAEALITTQASRGGYFLRESDTDNTYAYRDITGDFVSPLTGVIEKRGVTIVAVGRTALYGFLGDLISDLISELIGEFIVELIGEMITDIIGELVVDMMGDLINDFVGEFVNDLVSELIGDWIGDMITEWLGELIVDMIIDIIVDFLI